MDTPTRLLRLPAVLDRVGFSKATLYAKVKSGEFPAPVQLTARCVAWRQCDLDAYIAGLQPTRDPSRQPPIDRRPMPASTPRS